MNQYDMVFHFANFGTCITKCSSLLPRSPTMLLKAMNIVSAYNIVCRLGVFLYADEFPWQSRDFYFLFNMTFPRLPRNFVGWIWSY